MTNNNGWKHNAIAVTVEDCQGNSLKFASLGSWTLKEIRTSQLISNAIPGDDGLAKIAATSALFFYTRQGYFDALKIENSISEKGIDFFDKFFSLLHEKQLTEPSSEEVSELEGKIQRLALAIADDALDLPCLLLEEVWKFLQKETEATRNKEAAQKKRGKPPTGKKSSGSFKKATLETPISSEQPLKSVPAA